MKIIPPVSTSGNTDPRNLGMLNESHPNQLKVSIVLQVVFGSPSRFCAGSGVCRVFPETVNISASWPCPVWTGQLHWLASCRSFQLSFSLEQFTSAEINKWFPEGWFLIEEAFPLPLWLASLLGEHHCLIPAGRYPCKIQDTLTINLKIAKRLKKKHPVNHRLQRGA
jgi:hypothetical protein